MDDNRAAEKVPQIPGLPRTTGTKYMSRTNKKIPYGFHLIQSLPSIHSPSNQGLPVQGAL